MNQPPTLNPLGDIALDENAGNQMITLAGITAGAPNESEEVSISASSSNPALIPTPTISHTSPATFGTLSFTPTPFVSGSAVITVAVNDGQPTNNVSTRSFLVTISSVNQPPTLNALSNLSLPLNAAPQTLALSGITSGAPNEPDALSITATCSDSRVVTNLAVSYANGQTSGSLKFNVVSNAVGVAVVTVTVNDGHLTNNAFSRSFSVSVANQSSSGTPNQIPTLDPIGNVSLLEEAPRQVLSLSGISSGALTEHQALMVSASSSNPNLIPQPEVTYLSPGSTATLAFTPNPNAYGSASITVSVNDGQTTNNLVRRSFIVNISAQNDPPTLNAISDLELPVNSGPQTLNLSGISSGAPNELQAVSILASSSNPALVPNPTVNYRSGNSIGTLVLTPTANQSGTATITVTANDGQATNNTTVRQFMVAIGTNLEPLEMNLLVGSTIVQAGESGAVSLSLDANSSLTNLSFTVDLPPDRFGNVSIQALAPELAPGKHQTFCPKWEWSFHSTRNPVRPNHSSLRTIGPDKFHRPCRPTFRVYTDYPSPNQCHAQHGGDCQPHEHRHRPNYSPRAGASAGGHRCPKAHSLRPAEFHLHGRVQHQHDPLDSPPQKDSPLDGLPDPNEFRTTAKTGFLPGCLRRLRPARAGTDHRPGQQPELAPLWQTGGQLQH